MIENDVKLRNVTFWHKIFSRTDGSGEHFVILPKIFKCTLALCHSNAEVKISSANKRMLTKENMSLSEETIIWA